MIERIKYSTIADIYVRELIFYEKQHERKLKKMCTSWGITYLPAKNRKVVFRLVNGSFQRSELTAEITCNPYDRLFERSTISKFESGDHDEVLFAVENGTIKGVVHIVDFNKEFIFIEFYKLLHRFERMARLFLTEKKETNDSLLEWMKTKKTDSNWSQRYGLHVPKNLENRSKLEEKRR